MSLNTMPAPPANPAKSAGRRSYLLPLLVGVMMLVLTIRVGNMWQHLSVGLGTETQAQTAPTQNAPAQATSTQSAPVASAQNAAPTQPPAPGAAPSDAGTNPAASAAKDPLEYTDEEVEVLQQLAKRREELELKSRQLDEREAMVTAAEQRMEQKMAELKALQSTVEDLLKKRSDAEETRLQSLVKVYQNMKPKDAAQVFEELDMDVLLDVVSRMNERKLAPILALVSPTKAKEMTYELAQQKTLPFTP
jgi:flagellar motility protein MotE (MotC chaperone)